MIETIGFVEHGYQLFSFFGREAPAFCLPFACGYGPNMRSRYLSKSSVSAWRVMLSAFATFPMPRG
jgi:hypothetical protein